MKHILKRGMLAALLLSVGFLFALVTISGVKAQEQIQSEDNQQQDEQNQEDATEENSEEAQQENDGEQDSESQASDDAYTYTAQPGDSYTLMARKAVQTYGVNNSVNLSEAQIIFAETNLTLSANSPILNIGQEVTIERQTVAEWVEKAQQLSEEDQAAWDSYTAGVNFNTNAVGQAS